MSDAGSALMGIGFATGDDRAKQAAERALRSPLIDTEIVGARGILLSIAGGDDLTLLEVNDAAEVVRQAATDDTNIIFGATVDERLDGPDLGDGRRDRHRPEPPPQRAAVHGSSQPTTGSEDPLEPPSFLRTRPARLAPRRPGRARSRRTRPRARGSRSPRRAAVDPTPGARRRTGRDRAGEVEHAARAERDARDRLDGAEGDPGGERDVRARHRAP